MPQLLFEHFLIVFVLSLGAPYLGLRAWRIWRLLGGLAYLGFFEPRALVMMGVGSGLAWGLGPWAARHTRVALPLGVITIIVIFVLARGSAASEGGDFIVPLGFAFMLLRLTHYWIERCGNRFGPHTWLDVFGWLSYLPTVLVGPVQRFEDWMAWEARHRFDAADTAYGLRRVLTGYVKLVVLGYTVCGTWLPEQLLSLPAALATAIVQLLVLYWTFAGLSDVAVGLGRIWGQRIPENFFSPFLQPSLPRFWQSWHVTVGSFCRTYVFMPILASTRRPIAAAAGAIAVFALWHEPKLPYLAWGAWHGLGIYLWRVLGVDAPQGWPARVASTVCTWAWVLGGSVLMVVWPEGDAWWTK